MVTSKQSERFERIGVLKQEFKHTQRISKAKWSILRDSYQQQSK